MLKGMIPASRGVCVKGVWGVRWEVLKSWEEKLRENKSRLFHVRYEIYIEPFQMSPFMFKNDWQS